MSNEPRQRTRISDVPVANERLYYEVAKLTKMSKTDVEDIVQFTGQYIADVISAGTMEGVMLPYFGKFTPKLSKLRGLHKKRQGKANGRNKIWYAMTKGKVPFDERLSEHDQKVTAPKKDKQHISQKGRKGKKETHGKPTLDRSNSPQKKDSPTEGENSGTNNSTP